MDNPLAPWRDLSLVWLILLTMIFVAVPGALLYGAQLYLRKFNRWLKLPLRNAQMWALRIEQGTARVADQIAAVPITLHSAGTRVHVTTQRVVVALSETKGSDGTTIRPSSPNAPSESDLPENS